MRRESHRFMLTGFLFLLFFIFTFMVKVVDVKAIGPQNTSVGFATWNQFVFECLGVNLLWYQITEWIGIVALIAAVLFAVLGLGQLIQRKSILKVDCDMILLGVFYFVVILVYIFFERYIVNYRPIILDEVLEASYPSTHVMVVLCIMGTSIIQFRRRLKSKGLKLLLEVISAATVMITTIGRLMSGVHWFTDILGGNLLGIALIMLYISCVEYIKRRNKKHKA